MESNNGLLSDSLENNLRHNVVTTLHQMGYQQHRTLEISIDHGTVIVEGFVPTWYLRQVALECIRRVAGVVGVVDRIRVVLESQDDNATYVNAANGLRIAALAAENELQMSQALDSNDPSRL